MALPGVYVIRTPRRRAPALVASTGAGADWGRPSRRAGRPRGRGWWVGGLLLVAALAGGLGWAGARPARGLALPSLISPSYFRLVEVDVEGTLHVGREDVVAALAIPPGASLLGLDLRALGARLALNPWVKEALLERRLPDRLVVRLVERMPAAVLLAEGAYLVGADGVILEAVEEAALPPVPVLRAPRGRRYRVGERVAPQELSQALWAWRQVHMAPALGGRRPQELALFADGSYRLRLAPGPLAVRVRAEGLEPQLRRLGAVVALRGGALEDIGEVDLRFTEKVVLRPRGEGASLGGPPRGPAPAGRGDRRAEQDRPGGR